MIKRNFPIDSIVFNSCRVLSIAVEHSALKYGDQTEDVFKHIACTLDGQKRPPDEVNHMGEELFHVASCTSIDIFRDTIFKHDKKTETLVFFHSSPRKKKQYDRFPEKFKKGIY